jgi:methyl-accepting chemotaxis protein
MMKMTIRRKVLIILTLVAVVSAGTTSYIGYRTARAALEEQSFARLTAVREMKANQVEDYFRQISAQVITFSDSRMVVEAMREFRSAFEALEEELAIGETESERRDLALRLFYEESFLPRLRLQISLTSGRTIRAAERLNTSTLSPTPSIRGRSTSWTKHRTAHRTAGLTACTTRSSATSWSGLATTTSS